MKTFLLIEKSQELLLKWTFWLEGIIAIYPDLLVCSTNNHTDTGCKLNENYEVQFMRRIWTFSVLFFYNILHTFVLENRVGKKGKVLQKEIKGATKLHFSHYFVVIILFNTGLYKSVFSNNSFGKHFFFFFFDFLRFLLSAYSEFDVSSLTFVTFV